MYLNYFVFAILLNSVGIVKSQINYNDELQASILEAYKDLPIAIVSFDCLFYPRIGYKSHAYWFSHGYISLC
jgi:hypothetical protein